MSFRSNIKGRNNMLSHPFDSLERRSLVIAVWLFAAGFCVLSAILFFTIPSEEFARIQELAHMGSPANAQTVLRSWPHSTFLAFSFLLGFDFLFDLVHNNGVALFAIWGAQRLSNRAAKMLATCIAWLMWADSLLNVMENLAFFHVIHTEEASWLLSFAQGIFAFRSATLLGAFLVALVLHAIASHQKANSTTSQLS